MRSAVILSLRGAILKNKSIFTRYISTFLVIVFLGFLILTAIISTTTIQYANERKRTVAQNTSGLIYNYLSSEKIYPSALIIFFINTVRAAKLPIEWPSR